MSTIELDLAALYALVPEKVRMEMLWQKKELRILLSPAGNTCDFALFLPLVSMRYFNLGAQYFVEAQIKMLLEKIFPPNVRMITFTIPESPP